MRDGSICFLIQRDLQVSRFHQLYWADGIRSLGDGVSLVLEDIN